MECFSKKHLLLYLICFTLFKVNAQPSGGTTSGAAIYCAADNAGFITLSGYNGTIIAWEYSIDSVNWMPTGSAIVSYQSYDSLLQTTCFRAIVQDSTLATDTSTVSCVAIYPPSVGGTITGAGTFCIVPGSGTGTLTLTGNTGDVQYWEYSTDGGSTWTSVPDSNTTLNYPNITQGTLYRAVVQNGATCPTDTSGEAAFSFDSVTVAGILTGSDTICPGIDSGTINLTGYTGSILNWLLSTDGSSWTTITDTTASQSYNSLVQTTWYEVVLQNGTCPADTSVPAALTIVPNPVNAGVDTTIAMGESVVLNGSGNGTALWTPSAGIDSATVFTPTATPAATTQYVLTVTDNNNCITADSVLITVYSLEFDGMVSNLFTPNGDGINDTWYIQSIQNFPENEVFIYNIYGNLVYTKKGYANDWKGTYNGKELPDGTYYFVLRFDGSELVIKGSLDILRNK